MSINDANKLLQIRRAEGLTQKEFSELTGVALGTIKKYESGHQLARAEVTESVIGVHIFEKYALWLMIYKTAPIAGQVSPALSPDGPDDKDSHHSRPRSYSPNFAGGCRLYSNAQIGEILRGLKPDLPRG